MSHFWDQWTPMASTEWSRWSGNDYMEWVIEWKKHPWEGEKQVLKTEMRIVPGKGDYVRRARSAMRFNKSRADVQEYKPGGSIGSSTQSLSLSVGLPRGVDVTYQGSTTQPDLEVLDDTKWYKENFVLKYDISGELRFHTVNLNAAATVDTNWKSGETFAYIDLKSFFKQGYFNRQNDSISAFYRYHWV